MAASQYAVALARRFQSELHLLNVIDLRVYGMYGMGNDDAALERFGPGSRKAAEAEMGSFVPEELKNLTVKRVLLCGDPAHEIAKYAAANCISLIVMPTHGYGRFRRFLLGSVTTKVLHEVECPVWTGVHLESHPESSDMQFRRILVALEPWKAGQALEWAWQFGREVGAQVKIVHALPPVYGPGSSYFAAEMKTHVKGAAEQAIYNAQRCAGSDAAVEICVGEAVPAVCAAAREWSADLMVIGRGVATDFLGRLRTRSYAIIRDAPCPVVSV